MRDYKPKSKDKIKTEVKKHLSDIKDSQRSIDNVVEDAEKVSRLYKQIRDTRVTIDSAVEIDKAIHDVFKTVRKHHGKLNGNMETEMKDTSKTIADLDARTKDAEKNSVKVRETSRKITTAGARADLSKAESTARKDAQFTDSKRKCLEDCLKNAKVTQQTKKVAIYRFLSPIPNYLAEFEIGRAIQLRKGDSREKPGQQVNVDSEDSIEIDNAVNDRKGKSKQVKSLERALSDAELRNKKMLGKMAEQHKQSHVSEQQDSNNTYGLPLGNKYKQDKT